MWKGESMDKKFSDFLSQLTPEKLTEIADRTSDILEKTHENYNKDPKTSLGNQTATIALWMSLGLLEEYHEWLMK